MSNSKIYAIYDDLSKEKGVLPEELLRAFDENIAALIVDESARIVKASQKALALLDFRHGDGQNALWYEHICQDDKSKVLASWESVVNDNSQKHIEHRIPLNRDLRWLFSLWGSIRVKKDGVRLFLGTLIDITESEYIQHLAHHDELSGLPNRALFCNYLTQATNHAMREQCYLAVLYCDMDNFKKVNDVYGHDIGDALIKVCARFLVESTRKDDIVARLGGDEFAVIAQNIEDPSQIAKSAERIIEKFRNPLKIEQYDINTSVSVGIAIYPNNHSDTPASLLKHSDIAMYHAKEKGRNNFQFYSESLNCKIQYQTKLEQNLRRAVEDFSEFHLRYQPQIDLTTKEISGFEALIRWQNPELGEVPPLTFIPFSEELGLIHQIGRWVLRESCHAFLDWEKAFKKQGILPNLCVNLSVIQLSNELLVDLIKEALDDFHFPAERLVLEVTESSLMENIQEAKVVLEKIDALGVKISIDDFGTGYSSLNYLKVLPFSELKIDSSFVQDIQTNKDGCSIIKAIIQMGGVMGLNIVAEGVENKAQLQFLDECGCKYAQGHHFAQGFHFAKPMRRDEVLTYVEQYHIKHSKK